MSESNAATLANGVGGGRVTVVIMHRELLRFVRQPARIIAAIGTPVILWIFMGSGFSGAMSAANNSGGGGSSGGYGLYLLPGMMTLVAMFTAIFSSISVIEDRQAGWLQSVLVSPAPRWSIAAGKILGGALIAFIQAALLLLALPLVGEWPSFVSLLQVLAALAVVSVAMAGVGFAFAWVSESTQGFHAVMNLVLMPLWLLSGAFFSTASAVDWLRFLMYLNPLTWATAAIRVPLVVDQVDDAVVSSWWFSILIAMVFAAVSFVIATAVVSRRGKHG